MKSKIYLLLFLLIGSLSCEEEENIEDPVFEFVAFQEDGISLNEKDNSLMPYPLVAELLAYQPYQEDIELQLEITGSNAVEGEDFTVQPGATLKIKAGSLISDTLYLKTIDNSAFSGERSIAITIKSTSKPDIKIGLGIAEPKRASVSAQITDDECSETTAIFNTVNISNKITYSGGGNTTTVEGAVSGNELTLAGDLIDYSPFSGAQLKVTLIPSAEGATGGSANFGEQETGTDSDGYEYKFIQTGEGSYDVCKGTVELEYEIYYLSGGSWVYWYSVKNVLSGSN
jgi:hypothetical protein